METILRGVDGRLTGHSLSLLHHHITCVDSLHLEMPSWSSPPPPHSPLSFVTLNMNRILRNGIGIAQKHREIQFFEKLRK